MRLGCSSGAGAGGVWRVESSAVEPERGVSVEDGFEESGAPG